MDNWRANAWNGHQNEPLDSTVQVDSLNAFDAFGHRDDAAGYGHGTTAPGPYADTSGYTHEGQAYAGETQLLPADGQAYAPAGTHAAQDHPAAQDYAAQDYQGYATQDYQGYAHPGQDHPSPEYASQDHPAQEYAQDHTGQDYASGHPYGAADADPAALTTVVPAVDGAEQGTTVLPPVPAQAAAAAPAAHEPADGPVFVDESGRRSKKFRRLGWVLASACAVYAITLVVSVIGGNSAAPWLLIPGPADEKKTETTKVEPAPSTTEAPKGDTPGTVPGVPAPTDSTGAVIPRPDGSGTRDEPADPRPGTSSAPGTTPSKGSTGGTDAGEPPATRPTPQRPTDGGDTPQPPPVVPPVTPDPDPTDPETTPTEEEPTDPPVGDSGGQQMAAEGAQ
ncbi:hypothetical protein [Streptomyces sp. NPDC015131]|uniref:hypothetical protein n=1 Tax=Streptomyces sp. NPDC015131 TaxID=3364941 RepID=UPI0036FEF293